MYEQYFGLSEKPFSLTPNPRYVFQSEQYRVAVESLRYGIAQKEGFMLVTGAPGTGKTTLCRDLLEKLDPERYRVALLFNPFLNGVEMLQALLSEFGLGDRPSTSRKELLDGLNTYLLQQLANGRTCIAIFDEAQHLSTEFLEQIRVLSNLETEREKLIQIILVGQPELLTLIRTPQMAQLDQRVSVRCKLAHLSRDETGRYLDHRLNVAGAQGRVRIQEPAVRLIHTATGGVPRLINLAADRSLLAAYTGQARSITQDHVKQGLASLQGEDGIDAGAADAPAKLLANPSRRRGWWITGAATAALLVLVALWWGMDGTAELLAWRAARATSTAEAERLYAKIAREHSRSRQRENALLRLAQLQIARGSNDDALRSIETLGRDYPRGWAIGEGGGRYWRARAHLAKADTAAACAATRAASAAAAVSVAADLAMMIRECEAFASRRPPSDTAGANAMATADTSRAVVPAGSAAPLDSVP